MRSLTRFFIVFLAITGAVALTTGLVGVRFGSDDFWSHHGLFFLVFVTAFPRLTLILLSVPTGGLLWWVGWLFVPRLLVAVLATLEYWHQNPVLVVIAWLVAVGGESSEKYVVVRRSHYGSSPRREPKYVESEVIETRSGRSDRHGS